MNVNVPLVKQEDIRGFRLTRQGLRVYHGRLDEGTDPRGLPFYFIGGDAPTGVPERGTDIGALAEGYVSITPLHLDLTAYRALTRSQHLGLGGMRPACRSLRLPCKPAWISRLSGAGFSREMSLSV